MAEWRERRPSWRGAGAAEVGAVRHGRADSGVEADSAHQSAPESGTTRVRLGSPRVDSAPESDLRSVRLGSRGVRLGRRVGHNSCTTRIPRIRLGRRVAHRVVQLGIRVGTRRSDSAVRVGGPAARLGAREGPRVGAKESDSGPARGPESDRVCTVRSQVPVATLPTTYCCRPMFEAGVCTRPVLRTRAALG